jgi:hypothetical protein
MRHSITSIIITLCILIEYIKASDDIEEQINKKISVYNEILNNLDDVENIKKLIKKLVLFKDNLNESINIDYLLKEKLILKINKILLKIKTFYDDSKVKEDSFDGVYIKQQLNVERLNDITFIFDYFTNYNQSEHIIAHNGILSLIKFLNTNEKILQRLKFFLIIPKNIEFIIKPPIKNVNILIYKTNEHKYSRIFSYLLNEIETRYVFFGDRYKPPESFIDDNDYTFEYFIKTFTGLLDGLESNSIANAISTGLIRNDNFEITSMCAKSILKYYSLKYEIQRVDFSNENIYCDYVYKGNFLGSVRHFITIFDKIQFFDSDNLFFNNLFLELNLKNYRIMSSPKIVLDVAARQSYAKNKSIEIFSLNIKKVKEDFPYFMQKHEIELFKVYDESKSLLFNYKIDDCKVLKLNCKKNSLSRFHALPRCCREIISNFIIRLENECQKHNVTFELDSGTLLGAVKFSNTLPWEIDGDISYFNENHENLRTVLKILKEKYGYYYGYEKLPGQKSQGQFLVYARPYWIELYGMPRKHFKDTLNSTIQQTKIKLDDAWVSSPVSPGLWVRNRYGVNLFKHALSWRYTGLQHSFMSYSNQINNGYCPIYGYHSCMSALGNDGNFQYN